ncbi:Copper fist DNA binding domain protein [Diplocarpon rosae]|nr:Copper fist DNA binding domain protein [Diplocarpon rosae]
MLIKGEKYACEACVRGHRVSNCQHSDRPLQHINKKGRPVSQCTHCRTLRKSRSAHVSCDCGEKAHSKASCGGHEIGSEKICCCSHTGRCTCALKKEHLDTVPESDSDEALMPPVPKGEKRRPRALTAQSDGGLTVFTNGHHKPVHKHNKMASKCGLPYIVPRAHSIHGPSPADLAHRSVDNLLHTNTIDVLHGDSHIKDSMVSAQQEQRMAKSEHGSPLVSPQSNLEHLNSQLPPLDLTNIPDVFNFMQSYDGFAPNEFEAPIFSAGLNSATSIDWSHYDGLDFNNDTFATSSYSQAASFTGFDFCSTDNPALTTTSTSGEISEVEDFVPASDNTTARPALLNQYGSDFDTSDIKDIDGYRHSTASSYIGMHQAQMLASEDFDSLDIDAFLNSVQTSSAAYADGSHGIPITAYQDNTKIGHTPSVFDENANLQFPEESNTFWMQTFAPTGGPINTGLNEMTEDSDWAQ